MNKTAWPDEHPGIASLTVAAAIAVLMAGLLPVGAALLMLVIFAVGLFLPPVVAIRAIVRWRSAAAAAPVDEVHLATVVLEPTVLVQIGNIHGSCPLQHEWLTGQTFLLNGEVTGLDTPCEQAVRLVSARRSEMVTSGAMTATAACVGREHSIEFIIQRV